MTAEAHSSSPNPTSGEVEDVRSGGARALRSSGECVVLDIAMPPRPRANEWQTNVGSTKLRTRHAATSLSMLGHSRWEEHSYLIAVAFNLHSANDLRTRTCRM